MSVFYPNAVTQTFTPATSNSVEGWIFDGAHTLAQAQDGDPNTYYLATGGASASSINPPPATSTLTITWTGFGVGAFDSRPMQAVGLFRVVSSGTASDRNGNLTLAFSNTLGTTTALSVAAWGPATGNIDVTTTFSNGIFALFAGGFRNILASDFNPTLSPKLVAVATVVLPTQAGTNYGAFYTYETWAQDVPGAAADMMALLL